MKYIRYAFLMINSDPFVQVHQKGILNVEFRQEQDKCMSIFYQPLYIVAGVKWTGNNCLAFMMAVS